MLILSLDFCTTRKLWSSSWLMGFWCCWYSLPLWSRVRFHTILENEKLYYSIYSKNILNWTPEKSGRGWLEGENRNVSTMEWPLISRIQHLRFMERMQFTKWRPVCSFVRSLVHLFIHFQFYFVDHWLKLSFRPVCFGARDNQHGTFSVLYSGKLAAIKLVHLSGSVSCDTRLGVSHWSFWGCGSHKHLKDHVDVTITTSSNHLISPPSQFMTYGGGKWSQIPGFNSFSPEIVLPFFPFYSVNSGQQLHLWYGEDLVDQSEFDNGGTVCCDVYALYLWEVLARSQLQVPGRLFDFGLFLFA